MVGFVNWIFVEVVSTETVFGFSIRIHLRESTYGNKKKRETSPVGENSMYTNRVITNAQSVQQTLSHLYDEDDFQCPDGRKQPRPLVVGRPDYRNSTWGKIRNEKAD